MNKLNARNKTSLILCLNGAGYNVQSCFIWKQCWTRKSTIKSGKMGKWENETVYLICVSIYQGQVSPLLS